MSKVQNKIKVVKVLIGLCHIDKKLDKKEAAWIENTIQRLSFEPNQTNDLIKEIKNPSKNIIQTFQSIDDERMREKTLDLARYLFSLDDHLCENEKKIYRQLKDAHELVTNQRKNYTSEIANDLIKMEKDKVFYDELKTLGKTLSKKNSTTSDYFFSTSWIIHSLLYGNWMTRLVLILATLALFSIIIYRLTI